MDYASIDAENIDDANGYDLTETCSSYYDEFKSSLAPKKFLRHIKNMGSYYTALIDITACAFKDKYKLLFSNMHVHKLEPIIVRQPMFSWKNIVKRYIPDPDHAKYEEFKRRCLDDFFTSKRLTDAYGNVDRLDDESIKQDIYLHAEMNLLTNIIDQKYKGRAIIAVSKKSCYLCELYIRFVNKKGYKIYYTSGAHKTLYSKWLLPKIKDTDLRTESLNYMIKQLDQVINEEIAKQVSIVARPDSD
ncbi:11242_t:CDS:1 [Funneliformis mosseae]|uniref:11242_t:CDS:1 n=1 Tax=Funneliformis mosseae TaxID=27381 RepID=A0A9N8VT31_FUNMO|nr:11242_t:CDS:1 [Funneliformis mosseae]